MAPELGTSACVGNFWVPYLTYGIIARFGTGIAVAGYGAGAMITSFPVKKMIPVSGYAHTLIACGRIQPVAGVAV